MPIFDGVHIAGRLQGEKVEITVDTGASITFIPKDVFTRIDEDQEG